jgi:serine/threonine protein kinase/Tol biopolymer transport system component
MMALSSGTRVGPYEIISLLGAGGMGEVYRARDTRLDRTVALKILPPSLAADPAFRERFTREGRAISQLDHPHICTLYDVGEQDGTSFLVMQYLEGETLESRLKKGGLPLDQALQFAIQIADALDRAHRAGIVHRDLKPGNVMLTKSGAMLLDFGLAKATGVGAAAGLSMLPTTPPGLTAQGMILGTFQYMAPEQLEGREADARTDIFAFGSVLYEMVTGRKAFEGKSQASLIVAILEHEPRRIVELQPLTPPALEHLVQGCLTKAPEDRWQTAHDVLKELRWIGASGSQVSAIAVAPSRRRVSWAWVAASAAIGLLFGAVGGALYPRRSVDAPRSRFLVTTPELQTPAFPSISPDGQHIVFVARNPSGGFSLFHRSLDALDAQPLAGTDNATQPFWSPDSRNIGFGAQGKLKRIDVSGGPPQNICDVAYFTGGTWNAEGTIVFGSFPGPLKRVSASGGEPVDLTTIDVSRHEAAHTGPSFLPDGRHFLFANYPTSEVSVASLDTTDRKLVMKGGGNVKYIAPGYLLFPRNGTLMAQPFDANRLSLSGEPIRVADNVSGLAIANLLDFSVSNTGVLVYRSGSAGVLGELVWYDRAGKLVGRVGSPGEYRGIALSPDGKRLAVHRHQEPGGGDIWLLDLDRDSFTRFTSHASHNMEPVWSHSGRQLAFTSDRDGGTPAIYQKSASGGGNEELALKAKSGISQIAGDYAPDDQSILYVDVATNADVSILPLTGDREPKPFLTSEFNEVLPRFSPPDGRWIAYVSDETGRFEVYVQPYPERSSKIQISTQGGSYPRWARSGKELFYLSPDAVLMAVDISANGRDIAAGKPHVLFSTRALLEDHPGGALTYPYDVRGDATRFIINERVTPANQTAPLTVVLNWMAALKK